MRAPVRTAATMSIIAGVLAGCTTTTTGTLAQTTEPGPPLTSSRSKSSPSRSTSPTPTPTGLPSLPNGPMFEPYQPTVPAPTNWSTMTCQDYAKLDEQTQLAMVDAIMAAKADALHTDTLVRSFKTLADLLCTNLPSTVVRDLLTNGPPK